jgi:uncharacterized protein YkwD
MSWNYIDALLILLILLHVWYGWRRGFLLGLFDLLQWFVSLLAALRFYKPVAQFLSLFLSLSDIWLLPLAFFLVVILTGALIRWLGYLLFKRLPKEVHKKRVNQILGIIPGFANGLINVVIVAALFINLPLSDGLHRAASESVLANRFSEATTRVEAALSPIFDEAIAQTINFLTVRPEPESGERVDLPYTVTNTQPRPELETEMLKLVNRERQAAGLKPLEPDPELTEVARKHSADMFARGYFSHVNPEGKSPFDRMQADGVRFLTAGENLALAPTLSIAHTGLMNSPGHRANILRAQFGRLGIGVMDGGRRGLMVTQNFRN